MLAWLGFKPDNSRHGPGSFELIFARTGGAAHVFKMQIITARRIFVMIVLAMLTLLLSVGYMSYSHYALRQEIAQLDATKKKIAQFDAQKRSQQIKQDIMLNDYGVLAGRLYDLEKKLTDLTSREAHSRNVPRQVANPPLAMGGVPETMDKLQVKQWVTDNANAKLDRMEDILDQEAAIPRGLPIDFTKARFSSPFGVRSNPFTGQGSEFHNGLDFAAPIGTDVYASADGKVIWADKMGGLGNAVKIDHGYGYQTAFGHMSKILVENGSDVKAGDLIGRVGSTGRSSGPHLHYIVYFNGKAIDPYSFV